MIRPIENRDAAALTRIYGQAVIESLELAPVSQKDRMEWIEAHREPITAWAYEHPLGGVIGYCGLSPLSFRATCRHVAEIALFVDRGGTPRANRIGAALLIHLVEEARRLGLRSLFAHVLARNLPAIGGCVAFGFKPAATLREAAQLQGSWVDTLWMQKDLNDADPPRYLKLRQS